MNDGIDPTLCSVKYASFEAAVNMIAALGKVIEKWVRLRENFFPGTPSGQCYHHHHAWCRVTAASLACGAQLECCLAPGSVQCVRKGGQLPGLQPIPLLPLPIEKHRGYVPGCAQQVGTWGTTQEKGGQVDRYSQRGWSQGGCLPIHLSLLLFFPWLPLALSAWVYGCGQASGGCWDALKWVQA